VESRCTVRKKTGNGEGKTRLSCGTRNIRRRRDKESKVQLEELTKKVGIGELRWVER
jgi:hypothetical protein